MSWFLSGQSLYRSSHGFLFNFLSNDPPNFFFFFVPEGMIKEDLLNICLIGKPPLRSSFPDDLKNIFAN